MRSAYDLDSPRADWGDALCRGQPDLWFPSSWDGKARAAHMCGHCPVLTQCAVELARTPPALLSMAVVAGVAHNQNGEPARWPLPAMSCHRCWQPPRTLSLESRLRMAGR